MPRVFEELPRSTLIHLPSCSEKTPPQIKKGSTHHVPDVLVPAQPRGPERWLPRCSYTPRIYFTRDARG